MKGKYIGLIIPSFPHISINKFAPVVKLVDTSRLGRGNASCVGSSPIRRTFLSGNVCFITVEGSGSGGIAVLLFIPNKSLYVDINI